ncbi:precorrin-3B C(17)-methyltransferase [Brevibacillus formosus]|uniref:precorrin-3B C(17)-methyltransferase n=1 Tax=Brevibacillus TaxID=55080 RepID=UPI000D0F17EA|nr:MULTISPECIES: precorrin-3B C(17)-methyltransferase [Brevibacillus]MBG9943506.1 cobalt-precorrin-3B C(17)-methyltransferase [Brevibacillus formosus]MED1948048.1 precorrin-3B C(17)-methyltransferase [Brevibacillus formosus]MED1998221.1 precorrin-3B C(17)-methyltransferase [Brevibacillus formosus]MED2080762.1 precorrin-3B C(17)-methyltransferase [Brevibacillus formosus]PSK20569.1 precorrin-3B C(17)-methyltransferase [Brevibacillus sp. NRRL NRS-603]
MSGKLFVIGFGPGSFEHITKRAREALQESDVIIGYSTYVDLIRGLLTNQQIVSTGMTEEVARAREAVRQAEEEGKKVAVISSGDSGVYGMAGLVYEVLVEKGWTEATGVPIEIVPGISAINSCGAILGAPIMHDACTISLSDHLTPWELIAKRIDAAGMADFVIALYNPRSGRRTRQIVEAQRILLQYRSPDTPVGIVKSAYRERETVVVTTLAQMLEHDIGMLTTVIIGNTSTFVYDGKMITPRGYQRKYTLSADEQPLKPHQRLRVENEPWSLEASEESLASTPAAPATPKAERPVAVTEDSVTATEPANRAATSTAVLEAPPVTEESAPKAPFAWAMEALTAINAAKGIETKPAVGQVHRPVSTFTPEMIFECAVSPGVANKKITPQQMMAIAEVAGEKGEIEYTPHHQMILRVPTANPDSITSRLRELGLILSPIGDVLQVKACDFCDGEKKDSIPYADELHQKLGGKEMPKELKIGFNGCGMACYGAVQEDIGIVFRKGKFDLFLGAKTVGRNAHSGIPVAEGIEKEEIVPLVERIVNRFKKEAFPNERFHKFFQRVGELEGFAWYEPAKAEIENAACGD